MRWLFKQCGGEAALTRFLIRVVSEERTIDGVRLEKSSIGQKWQYWHHPQHLMYSGDWWLNHQEKNKEFEVWWLYEKDKAIIITVRIEKKGLLKLVSIVNEKDAVTLTP